MARTDERSGGLIPPWMHRDRPVPRAVMQPIAQFLHREVSGGVLLLGAAVVALLWANSPWSSSYDAFWDAEIGIDIGAWGIHEHLRGWVNDLLMAFFFYVVGLEIKREMLTGELRDPKAAALPVVAALGGMVVPALVFLLFNPSGDASSGWGIPMATDIAFAVGVLSLFSNRIPRSLTLFVLALAIADDIGAIVVIAIFYTADLNLPSLGVAIGILVLMVGMLRLGIRAGYLYAALAFGVWLATFESGVHATIAGVALGFVTPHRPWQRPEAVGEEARRIANLTDDNVDPTTGTSVAEWLALARLSRQAVSPLSHNEEILHPWISYLILPIFALANAGVNIGEATESGIGAVATGVALGLILGKTIGISIASFIAVKTGLGVLPRGVTWGKIVGAAAVAGIGFTVALFVANLAFDSPDLLNQAKIGVLGGSLIAALIGISALALSTRPPAPSPEPTPDSQTVPTV